MQNHNSSSISWQDSGEPYSTEFNDIYFSKDNGLKESQYIFLQHNNLAARFKDLKAGAHFCIAETGFGTGLNFLATWQLWQQTADQHACLHYISSEKYPLNYQDIKKALALWPELNTLAKQLILHYPKSFYPGFIDLQVSENVSLTLLIGDSYESYRQLEASVDAWFLDGFAPSKNPQMWHDQLFKEIYRLSHSQTTLATFTAASQVRKSLQNAGFIVKKDKGYGYKREMIYAMVADADKSAQSHCQAYLSTPKFKADRCDRIAVIGAGLAGCAIAYTLNKAGFSVDLYEKNRQPAHEASGNPYGILKPYITADGNLSDQFHSQGFLATWHFINQYADQVDFKACGALELLTDDKAQRRYQRIFEKRIFASQLARLIDAQKASKISGVTIKTQAVYYPMAMMVNPASLCRCFLNKANQTNTYYAHKLIALNREAGQWRLTLQHKATQIDKSYHCVIIAGGVELMQNLPLLEEIPIYPSLGQLSMIKPGMDNKTILLDKGYILPQANNMQIIGASFRDNNDLSDDIRLEDHLSNLAQIAAIGDVSFDNIMTGRVSMRAVSSDHLPLVGPVADYKNFHKQFAAPLAKGYKHQWLDETDYSPGLYISTGFGSKGMCSALIAARNLTKMLIAPNHLSVPRGVFEGIHPLRFWVRNFKRGKC
ncbi:bifunctional tRNA (5-methylaminomethyl-2-thiouridine)(34)-methyltransferase MnmD/FAD-dependent 5-carboxymethylaminomethyl-2-thiouridine(34) oxidoreductase MnmC [Facilibium subflavum]|uniref:bifunctional tRNA (5-methylaminomethyl-2-thiouridine)(34)-methyltransferase MnmD/FAD-dependent 5-carboxymethylaminomethyl-2-thiouridine(34) oxidoreductase MnmC n=1 Tax=Facilibium subflavum TaxID=2219058 RepID=UPI0013C2CC88|nr:bifunctional tRNA (5-methylaminomethyl-2-thiouridine)(34)-methyltransferase MnmD/FAD-dependent 5-carboxymethylaminomethyl-2-thiouridine(34) oxidoreductase MnmC [Facilibium subflavum]